MKNKVLTLYMMLVCALPVCIAQKNVEIEKPVLPINEDTKLVTYREVIPENAGPQELYDRAMQWVKSYYKNIGEVIKSNDREKGVIELRSSVRIYTTLKDGSQHFRNIVYYNFRIECRPDRYRFTITDFNEKAVSAAPIEVWFDTDNPKWDPSQYEFLKQIDSQIQELIASLKQGMLPKIEKNDDW